MFCRKQPASCAPSAEKSIALTAETSSLLRSVNDSVNRRVIPVELRGPDVWATGRTQGHCAIFAVQKRHELIERGIPAAALSLAVVSTRSGVLHLVLVVHTSAGAVVLDNLTRDILPWSESSHSFHSLQSRDNPMIWVAVAGRQPVKRAPALHLPLEAPRQNLPAPLPEPDMAMVERHIAESVPLPPPVDTPLAIMTLASLAGATAAL